MVPPVRIRSAAHAEANSVLSGRMVDGYTNILSVKLFAHAEREERFGWEAFEGSSWRSRCLMDGFDDVALMTINAALRLGRRPVGLAVVDGNISVGGIAGPPRW